MSTGAGVERIRSRYTFQVLRRSGSRGRSGPITVTFVQQTSWSKPQVAYALGRKLGGAVVRNRLRRRLRAIVDEQADTLLPGAYLVSTGPGGTGLPFNELRMAMGRAMQTATGARVTRQPTEDTGHR